MSLLYKIDRRDFLKSMGFGAGAAVFAAALPQSVYAAIPSLKQLINGVPVPNVPFALLKGNGDLVIVTFRSEMGQGIRSSLAAVLADEMEADWNRVSLRQADAEGEKFAIEFPYKVPDDLTLPFPYDEQKKYLIPPDGSQFTDSSRSMTAYFGVMRLMGAGLRLGFIRAAAKKWGVDEKQCRAEKHRVYGPGGKSIDYRWLLLRAQKENPLYSDIEAAQKAPEQWRYIGKAKEAMPFYDAVDMVRGKTEYGADVEQAGMLVAMIERCPVANGALVSYDPAAAMAVPGVRHVLPIYPPGKPGGGVGRAFMPHAGVAVVATNTWAALQGRRALRPAIQWDRGQHASYDSDSYRKELEDSVSHSGTIVRAAGNVDDAALGAGTGVKAMYHVPHLAQAPMEPPAALAIFRDGAVEVWAPTQSPHVTQIFAGAIALGMEDDCDLLTDAACQEKARKAAKVHITMLGGGFGRKSKPDYVLEAVILAKQLPGVPVRVQWTREDDIKFSYYNAVSSQYLQAALGGDGLPSALLQRSALTSFFGTLFPNEGTPGASAQQIDAAQEKRNKFVGSNKYPYASGIERAQGLEDVPYNVPNLRIENCPAKNHIRVGWMRSVANIYHAFGICSFADEMARASGPDTDSKNYLLKLIGPDRIIPIRDKDAVPGYRNNELPLEMISVPAEGSKMKQVVPGYPPDTSRLRAAIDTVAELAGWDDKVKKYKGTKRGLGIAAHRSFLSYVAIVVDASFDDNQLTIHDVYGAIHCGLAVNRDRVVAQMEGGIVYGLSYALLGEITVKKGEVVQNNFDDYPVLRIHQTPKIHVAIVDSLEAPTGVGEPPTPAVAPALCNAIAAAGGPRIRALPLVRSGITLAPA